jgi:hypothetical protein
LVTAYSEIFLDRVVGIPEAVMQVSIPYIERAIWYKPITSAPKVRDI